MRYRFPALRGLNVRWETWVTLCSRVEGAGGKVLQPKNQIGEFGYIAMILDAEGNRIGLHSPN